VTSGWSLISATYSPTSRISGTSTRRLSTSLRENRWFAGKQSNNDASVVLFYQLERIYYLLSWDFMISTRSCDVTLKRVHGTLSEDVNRGKERHIENCSTRTTCLPKICFPFPPLRGTLNAPIVSNTRASCCASSFT
jgi:hypothetical protein